MSSSYTPKNLAEVEDSAPKFGLAVERVLDRTRDSARPGNGEGGIRTLERGFPRYAISSRARSTAPAPLQRVITGSGGDRATDRSSAGGHP